MKISRQILLLLVVFYHALSNAQNALTDTQTSSGDAAEEHELNLPSLEMANATTQTPELIDDQIKSYLDDLSEEYAEKGYRSEYKVGNISPYLREKSCKTKPEIELNRQPLSQNMLTLNIKCYDKASWKYYVSIEFNLFGQIVMSQNSIRRGQVIEADDIKLSETLINKSHYSHYSRPQDVIGMVVKRTIRSDATIQPTHLKPPMLIKRGDNVIILASNSAISVRMNGTALTDGTLGQQISVKNNQSKRVVKGMVSERGMVKIIL